MSSFNPLIQVMESSCQSWIWAAVRKRGGSLFSRPSLSFCASPPTAVPETRAGCSLQSTDTDEGDRRALTAQSCIRLGKTCPPFHSLTVRTCSLEEVWMLTRFSGFGKYCEDQGIFDCEVFPYIQKRQKDAVKVEISR